MEQSKKIYAREKQTDRVRNVPQVISSCLKLIFLGINSVGFFQYTEDVAHSNSSLIVFFPPTFNWNDDWIEMTVDIGNILKMLIEQKTANEKDISF